MMVKNSIKTRYFSYSKNANKINVHKRKNHNISSGYLPAQRQCKLQNKVCDQFKVNKKKHRDELIDMRTLRNIDLALVSLYLFLEFDS